VERLNAVADEMNTVAGAVLAGGVCCTRSVPLASRGHVNSQCPD
jgi:hypothetical protein